MILLCFLPLTSSNNTTIILSKIQQTHRMCRGKNVPMKCWQVRWKVDLWLTIPFRRISKCSLLASRASPNALPLTSCSSNNTWHVIPPTEQALSDLWSLSFVAGTLMSHLLQCFETQSMHHYCQETSLLLPQCSTSLIPLHCSWESLSPLLVSSSKTSMLLSSSYSQCLA